MKIRTMTINDYDQIFALWGSIDGFGIRTVDDSRAGIASFIKRNPYTSVVAVDQDQVVGSILCGHDGRRGCFYHVCVARAYRNQGIGSKMVTVCLAALKKEGINQVNLIAFKKNHGGNQFWQQEGWKFREDVNYYEMTLNTKNITEFIAL